MEHLKALIRDVPDFPSPGILFRDIVPLLRDARAFREVTDALAARYADAGVDLVAGVESRGFLFGSALAHAMGVGFTPIRKVGKLPGPTIRREYALEYGTSHLEIQRDAVRPGERVLLIDDVLATGGTARAGLELIGELGGVAVGAAFVLEIGALGGRRALEGHDVFALLGY